MGRRRHRPPPVPSRDYHDDHVMDMTSYDDVTRSSALLAYIELTAADRQLGVSVIGYTGDQCGGLYVSQTVVWSVWGSLCLCVVCVGVCMSVRL